MDLITVGEIRSPRNRAEIGVGAGAVALGGGTWLFSEPQPDTTSLVDLTSLDWNPIEVTDSGLTLAATCTVAELLRFDSPADWLASALFLPCAESMVASFKVWNHATVGGNICLALPAGPFTSLAASLDAVAVIWQSGGGERRMPVADLVLGNRSTALADTEFLRSIEIPRACLQSRTAFRRISLSTLGRSGALLIGRLGSDGELSITVTAATTRPHVLRFSGRASALEVRTRVEAIDDWYDDPHGAPDWRRAMSVRFAEEIRAELVAS